MLPSNSPEKNYHKDSKLTRILKDYELYVHNSKIIAKENKSLEYIIKGEGESLRMKTNYHTLGQGVYR